MARYPSISAGQRVTASLLSSMLPDVVWKTSNTDRQSTTTLAEDPDLTVTLEANATYFVEIEVHYATTSAAGFQTDWTVPSGTTGGRCSISSGSAQTTYLDVPGNFGVHNYSTAVSHGDRNSTTNQLWLLERSIVATTNSGTCALRWAQDVSTASNTRVGAGSFMVVRRLA